ncbi:MAG: DUF4013 domain-containing protein [Candidatus Diapherotrites archaeon]|nr:DUF4013 domain-containing protein [Candidatus Diapherotrites archaeon]
MVSFGTAIKRPFQDLKTAIIGIILGAIPVVNILTVPGFALRNAKKSLEGDDSLLSWGDWGDIIVKSILLIVLLLIYIGIIVAIFFAVFLLSLGVFGLLGISMESLPFNGPTTTGYATAFPTSNTGIYGALPGTKPGASLFGSIPVTTLGIATVFAILYILSVFLMVLIPMAIMHWVKQDSFTAGLAIPSLFRRTPYITAIFYSSIYSAVLTVVGVILTQIPVVGIYLAMGFVFYAGATTISTLFAQAYRELEQRAATA